MAIETVVQSGGVRQQPAPIVVDMHTDAQADSAASADPDMAELGRSLKEASDRRALAEAGVTAEEALAAGAGADGKPKGKAKPADKDLEAKKADGPDAKNGAGPKDAAAQSEPKDDPAKAASTRKAEVFAEKAKAEKRDRERRQAEEAKMKAAQAEAASAKKELAELRAEIEDWKKTAGDPIALLKKAGSGVDDVMHRAIHDGKAKVKTPDEQIAELRAELAERDRAQTEREVKATEKAKAAEKAEAERRRQEWYANEGQKIAALVKEGGEKYEMIALDPQGVGRVLSARDYLYEHGDDSLQVAKGTVVPLDRVAEIVESYLFEDAEKRFRSSKKLAARLTAAAGGEGGHVAGAKGGRAAPNAISSRKAAPIAAPAHDRIDLLDDDEALAAATAMLRER